MPRGGHFDFSELKGFAKTIETMEKKKAKRFYEEMAKELTARLLAKVIPLTPVGEYAASTGKKGGTLRRGWTTATEDEAMAGVDNSINQHVDSLEVTKEGNVYQINIINPVHYALFREYGHRTVNGAGQGWVEGSFMLTISEEDLRNEAPRIIQRKLEQFLKENLT